MGLAECGLDYGSNTFSSLNKIRNFIYEYSNVKDVTLDALLATAL